MTRREKERMQKKKTKITLENVRQRPRRFQCIVICLVDVGPFCMNVCMSLVHNRAKIDIKSNLNFCPTTISQDFSFTLCVFKGKSFSLSIWFKYNTQKILHAQAKRKQKLEICIN